MASWRCVRPIFTTSSNCRALAARAWCRCSRAGTSDSLIATAALTCMAVGITSLELCSMFTWSLGWTGSFPPRLPVAISLARLAITSLAFMFVDVPLPVWKMSTTNSASSLPSNTSCAACWMRRSRFSSSRPRSWLTCAHADLISPIAAMNRRLNRRSEIGKFSTARPVWRRSARPPALSSPPSSLFRCEMRRPWSPRCELSGPPLLANNRRRQGDRRRGVARAARPCLRPKTRARDTGERHGRAARAAAGVTPSKWETLTAAARPAPAAL